MALGTAGICAGVGLVGLGLGWWRRGVAAKTRRRQVEVERVVWEQCDVTPRSFPGLPVVRLLYIDDTKTRRTKAQRANVVLTLPLVTPATDTTSGSSSLGGMMRFAVVSLVSHCLFNELRQHQHATYAVNVGTVDWVEVGDAKAKATERAPPAFSTELADPGKALLTPAKLSNRLQRGNPTLKISRWCSLTLTPY